MIDYFDDLEILTCWLDLPFNQEFAQRWPGLLSLQFVFKGEIYFGRDEEAQHTLRAPVLYWIEPAHFYRLGTVDGKDLRHGLLFNGLRGRRMLEALERMNGRGFVRIPDPQRADELFRRMSALWHNPAPTSHARMVLLLEDLMAGFATAQESGPVEPDSHSGISALADLIRLNPFRAYDLEGEARKLALSYSHFRRLFRQRLKRSPHDYVLHCRMLAACKMLQDRRAQVKDVAFECGFDDAARFTRTFKKQIGITPADYRRM